MKNLLKLEQLGILLLSIFLFTTTDKSILIYILFFLTPDISMLGYLINNKVGAIVYNFFHHQLFSVFIILLGHLAESSTLIVIGAILLGHSALDRVLGFGLKKYEGFKFTHLGKL